MNQTSLEEGAKILQNYSQWLSKNMNDLANHYPGKIIAIQNDRVVAVGETYQEVYAFLKTLIKTGCL